MPNGEMKMDIEADSDVRMFKNKQNNSECEPVRKMKSNDNSQNLKNINEMNQYLLEKGPKELKRFTAIEYIGRGSESSVYKIRLNGTNKFYCLKLIQKKKRKINKNEYTISTKIKSQYLAVVLYYYADKNSDFDYMIMELGSFDLSHFTRKIIRRNTLSESFLCLIAYQVLKGLSYLHMCKIAHLDIKAQNIIVTEYLDIKLIDFSVSLDYSKNKEEIILPYCGTPYYMSPEVMLQKRIKTKELQKVDLFSLGVTLYVLGFGRLPFGIIPGLKEVKDEELLEKMNSGWKVENTNNIFSEHFINFLNGLLEVNINKRMDLEQALNSHFIKGAQLILDEKENIYNANSFLSNLITDHIRTYQEFISNKSNSFLF